MGIAATLGAAMWAMAIAGLVAAGACYWVVPWDRVVDADEAPEGVPAVYLTRVGVTLGALSLVPAAAGGWLQFAGTMADLQFEAGAGDPTLLERAAVALPGEAIMVGSLAAGILAIFAPVWVGLGTLAWLRVQPFVTDTGA